MQRGKSGFDEGRPGCPQPCAGQHKMAELVNLFELRVELGFEHACLGLRELATIEIEDLLGQQLQDVHRVLAQIF